MTTEIIIWGGIFIASLFVLVKASDYFTAAAEQIGLKLGISPFIVGVVIISVGTSLPELISSLFAVMGDATEIVPGNVLGSNIANIFLVLGVSAVIGKNFRIKLNLQPVQFPVLLFSAAFLWATFLDGIFSRGEAFLFTICMVLFLAYTVKNAKEKRAPDLDTESESGGLLKSYLILAGSSFAIFAGANYTIESIVAISDILNIGKEIIAISAVALGTSLPELAVSISAARKKKYEIVIGNVLGSNIFNTFAVLGIPGLVKPLIVPIGLIDFSVPVMMVATVLFMIVLLDRRVSRLEGAFFLVFYAFFIGKTFNLL